jgi:hypothetical protein
MQKLALGFQLAALQFQMKANQLGWSLKYRLPLRHTFADGLFARHLPLLRLGILSAAAARRRAR